MRLSFYKIFSAFHIAFIALACTISTYNSYCEFYSYPKNNLAIKAINKVISPAVMKIYGTVSGCDNGYGFFAPNVRSSGLIFFENNGIKYIPEFSNREAAIRFSAFETNISDYMLKNKEPNTEKPTDSLTKQYYNLLYKSIAVKFFNKNHCTDKNSSIFYSLYEYPSLMDFRKKTGSPKLIKLFELQTSVTF